MILLIYGSVSLLLKKLIFLFYTYIYINLFFAGKPRSVAGVATLSDLLYVIGGFDGTNYLSDVDVYDPLTNCWASVSPLNETRSAASIAVMKGRIFALGGFNGQFLSSVEVYDPAINQWSYVQNMSIPRVHFGATVV